MTDTIDAYPAPTEIAVVHLPAGGTARVHRPNGAVIHLLAGDTAQVHHPDGTFYTLAPLYPGAPVVAVVAADPDLIGWGAIVLGETMATVRNNHHRLDRPAWHKAARAVRAGGVAYVTHEQVEHFGQTVWRATGARTADRQHNPTT